MSELDLYLIDLSSAFRQVVQLKMWTTEVVLAGVFFARSGAVSLKCPY
jgi:hypothetical protein